MSVNIIQLAQNTHANSSPSLPVQAGTANFAATLSATLADASAANPANGKADFVSGRLGIDLDRRGQPAKVVFFDEAGRKIKSSAFSAEQILRYTDKFNIDLEDLSSLGAQLDAAGIGYRPYELYKGTGSDHGINFDDLIAGGLGTAYDWRKDENVGLKGGGAARQLQAAQSLAEQLGLVKNTIVTTESGIDPARFAPLQAGGEDDPRNYVMFNGGVASWYRTGSEATAGAAQYAGTVIDLTPNDANSPRETSTALAATAMTNTLPGASRPASPAAGLSASATEGMGDIAEETAVVAVVPTEPPDSPTNESAIIVNKLAAEFQALLAAGSTPRRLSSVESLLSALTYRTQQTRL